jgi:type III secretion protein L
MAIIRGGAVASGSGRVITAALFDAAEDARAGVAAAHREAEEILCAARAEAAELRAAARGEGREMGLAEATATIALAAAERERLLAAAEGDVVELAFAVAALVVGVAAERGVVVEVARRALETVRSRAHVTLRAHPDDLAVLRAAEPGLAAALGRAPGIALCADPAVARGGVVVETEAGSVDATLAAQVGALRRAVTGAAP